MPLFMNWRLVECLAGNLKFFASVAQISIWILAVIVNPLNETETES